MKNKLFQNSDEYLVSVYQWRRISFRNFNQRYQQKVFSYIYGCTE